MLHAKALIPVASMVLAAGAALAQTTERQYDRVDFSVSAEREIENDVLIAVVYSEVEDNDQEDAADEVNRTIRWAADRARASSDIEMQTTQYTTRPVYAPNSRRIIGWIARQSLRLESRNAEALGTLLGTLQERVALQSLNYSLSKEARDAAEDLLIAEALARFNGRAELIAEEMGRDGYRIVSINVNSAGSSVFSRARGDGFFAEAQVAAPEIAAGQQTLTVAVNGAIELLPAP